MRSLDDILRARDPVERRRLVAAFDTDRIDSTTLSAFLRTTFADEEFAVRWAAVDWAVKNHQSEGLIEILGEMLTDAKTVSARAAAMEALGQIGEPAVPLLRRIFSNPNAGIRRLVVDALGFARTESSLQILQRATADDDASVRGASTEALSRLGSADALNIVESILSRKDEDHTVILTALLALIEHGHKAQKTQLKGWLNIPILKGPTLQLLGREGEVELLLQHLSRSTAMHRDFIVRGLIDAKAKTNFDLPNSAAEMVGEQLVSTNALRSLEAAIVLLQHGKVRGLEYCASLLDLMKYPNRVSELFRIAADSDDPRVRSAMGLYSSNQEVLKLWPTSSEFEHIAQKDMSNTARFLERELGLEFTPQSEQRLLNRLHPISKEYGYQSWSEFLRAMSSDAELFSRVADVATIHETYFYREARQLETFRNQLVPHFLGHQALRDFPAPHPPFRVWSAGCSTGEEAYSLGITIQEQARPGDRYQVHGTDISDESIAAAKAGSFSRRSFRGFMPQRWNERFVGPHGARVLDEESRNNIEFSVANLMRPPSELGKFHVIVCRNVLIYFSKAARKKVIKRFHDHLHVGGFLLLGHSESLLHTENPFEIKMLDKTLFYTKLEDS